MAESTTRPHLSARQRARHALGVYRRSLGAHLRSIVEYPADFWVMASTGAFWQVLQFAFLAVLFANVSAVDGWNYHEMLILVGFLTLATAGPNLTWDGIWSLGTMVVKGEIDYRITRPAPVLVQVATTQIGMQAFGELTLGTAMLTYGWIGAGLGLAQIPVAIFLLICAVVVEMGLLTIACSANFWIKGQMSTFAILLIDLQENGMRFPLGIYPAAVRVAAVFIVPLAFANFIPVQILTGRMSEWWLIAPPIAAAATTAIAVLVTRAGIRAYDSAGH